MVISDGFCKDIQTSLPLNGVRHAVVRRVYEMMCSEYVEQCCHHHRSVPVLLKKTNFDNVPPWLKNTHFCLWPKHYRQLFEVIKTVRQ